MVKRSRSQITPAECVDTDVWEQRCNQRAVKKKKFTVIDSLLCNPKNGTYEGYMNFKMACLSFAEIQGEDATIEGSHFALLVDGNIVHIKRAKAITHPSLFGGNKLCFVGKIFIRPASTGLEESFAFVPTEVLETKFYCVILEDQIKKDVSLKLVDKHVPMSHSKNTFICRYHFDHDVRTITPLSETLYVNE